MNSKEGFVYVLTSPNTECIKIGGSDFPPMKRIKEINATPPYKDIGPWSLADFRQVHDWRAVEYNLHYTFRSKLNTVIENQKELFEVSLHEVSRVLSLVEPEKIINKPKIDRMFQDKYFLSYLENLFKFSGLLN